LAAAYFVDSSVLVKRYILETGTAWVRGITRQNPSTVVYIARITAIEVTCAVARRRKGRTLTPPRASSILRRFRQHLAARYTVIDVTPDLVDDAMRLGNAHAMRAYDAVPSIPAMGGSPSRLCQRSSRSRHKRAHRRHRSTVFLTLQQTQCESLPATRRTHSWW
jgi:predicted nucleic acid-binding protein